MLAAEERTEIEAEFALSGRKAVCIDAMKIVQKHRGWVSDEALRDIGEPLGMSDDRPGRHRHILQPDLPPPGGPPVIHTLDSVSCWIMGYRTAVHVISERLAVDPVKPPPTGGSR